MPYCSYSVKSPVGFNIPKAFIFFYLGRFCCGHFFRIIEPEFSIKAHTTSSTLDLPLIDESKGHGTTVHWWILPSRQTQEERISEEALHLCLSCIDHSQSQLILVSWCFIIGCYKTHKSLVLCTCTLILSDYSANLKNLLCFLAALYKAI